ncbi:MAG: serine hydrolase, partial [Pseudomonadota bacterium]
TLFQAGSISKPVAAIAALKLVEAGRLDLDANVNSYLKGWKVPDNVFTADKKVTLRGLLTHTAGLTVHGFPGYAKGEAVPSLTQILDSVRPANTSAIRVDTVPGAKWRYSGGGYVVMQKMLEDVTGKKFDALAKETVLAPLGMTHSTYAQPLPAAMRKSAATPYDAEGVPVDGGAHTYPEMTAAGLWSTASDLARYAIGVQQAAAGKPGAVLNKATTEAMLKRGGLGKWGLGPELGGGDARPWFGHGGVDEGFVANLTAYNDGEGVAVMTNGMGGMRLANDIRASIAREYGWPDFAPKDRKAVTVAADASKRHVGAYRLGPYSVMRVTQDGTRLFATNIEGVKYELFAASDDLWFRADANMDYRFETRRLMVTSDGGAEVARPRLSDAEAAQVVAALSARVKAQKPQAGAEAALRKSIAGLASGDPDYAIYNEAMAAVTRRQLPALKNLIAGLGPLKSIAFVKVQPDGMDVYKVRFANGDSDWRIVLEDGGKISAIGF